jgi:hypothetical protein
MRSKDPATNNHDEPRLDLVAAVVGDQEQLLLGHPDWT